MDQRRSTAAEVPDLEMVVTRPLGSPLVQAYLSGDEAVRALYGGGFESLGRFREKAREVDARFDAAARARAAEAMVGPEDGDGGRLERWVREGGLLVTTGQQPGLFGGPLYGIHKALTAVRLAEVLEAELERPVIPLFWVASDDHDWAEANHAHIVGVDNELHRVELEAADPERTPPLHRIPLGSSVSEQLDRFLRCLPDTEFTPDLSSLLRSSFTPEATLPEAYLEVMRALLGRFGLYFTDAAHPAVKEVSGPLLLDELGRAAELEHVLRSTAESLERHGYGIQVPILEGGVNLFLEGTAGRERLYQDDGAFRLRASGERIDASGVQARFEEDPRTLSPNVLLRPVVESAVFPTLAYVGGPGEMAYFGQLGAYFETHGVGMPVVYPRWAATTVESKIRKVLDKFSLDIERLATPFHELSAELAREDVPDEVRSALGKLRGAIAQGVAEIQSATRDVDPTLKGPVQHVRSQAFQALDDLERKVMQAVKRESEIALAQVEKASVHLYPEGKPAERVHNVFYFLARYGEGFLDALYARFAVELE